ncbi:Uncharacterized protein FWK35_00015464 [Aphis craccivora]|uniref:Uncharacterized protein n=1 Tax=Aphis craccivora TaxID=307492 RepID=A0A6G0YBN6_APHCR|nr:Uncharacterized protein FWK35_00015464 [Aphis craccivora]
MSIPENIKIKKKIVPRPIDDVRLDRYDHNMPIVGIKGRCRMCKTGQTTILCDKCASRLNKLNTLFPEDMGNLNLNFKFINFKTE